MSIKIMLDRGHYGKRNRSPVVKEYYESERMWLLGAFLKEKLLEYGFFVGDTRDDPEKDLAVFKRGEMAKGYDLFLSLHSDAVGEGGSQSVSRVSVYASYDNKNDSWALGAKLAETVASAMGIPESYLKTRKSEKGDWEYYGVLRGAASVGCPLYYIVEHSFHTNPYSALWLMSDANLKKLASAEAKTIADHYGYFIRGDVNGDGDLDPNDYALLKRAVLKTYDLKEAEKERADMNSDGKITARDYQLLKRKILEE